MCALILSTNFVWSIQKRTERDVIRYVYWSVCKVSAIFATFCSESWTFSSDFFEKYANIECHTNSFSWSRAVPRRRLDRQADRHDEANCAFRNLANARKKDQQKIFTLVFHNCSAKLPYCHVFFHSETILCCQMKLLRLQVFVITGV
jgi:hypothetical protein